MKKILEMKWLTLAYGVLLVAVGALTIVFAITKPEVVTSMLSIAIAVSLFIIGVANIALALIAHTNEIFTKSLLIGSAAIAVGVYLCIDRLWISTFIMLLLGIFFVAFAFVMLLKFVIFIIYKQSVPVIVLYGVIVLVAAAAGIVILCFRDQVDTYKVLYIIIGAFIALAGLFEIIVNAVFLGKAGKIQNNNNEVVQEQEPVVVEAQEQKEEPEDSEQPEEEQEDNKENE